MKRFVFFWSTVCSILTVGSANASCTLSAKDEAAVRTAAEEYVSAWLSNKEERVMDLLLDEIVLTPPMGVAPKVGIEAARDFWFPKDSPPFIITKFKQDVTDVKGCKDLAVLRGRQNELEWDYDGDKYFNKGSNYISVYKKHAGEWKLLWQTWNTLGTEKISETE